MDWRIVAEEREREATVLRIVGYALLWIIILFVILTITITVATILITAINGILGIY